MHMSIHTYLFPMPHADTHVLIAQRPADTLNPKPPILVAQRSADTGGRGEAAVPQSESVVDGNGDKA